MTRRIVTAFLVMTAIILAALEIPLAFEYRTNLTGELKSALEREAFALSSRIETELAASDSTAVISESVTFANSSSARVVVVDANGKSVVDTEDPAANSRDFSNRPEFEQALSGYAEAGSRYSNTLGSGFVFAAVPIVENEKVVGAVRLTLSTSSIDDRVRRYWLFLGLSGIATLIAAALIAWLFAAWVRRPLTNLQGTAVKIRDGDLSARADQNDGPPETRDLAESFNLTADRLQAYIETQRQFVSDASHQLRTPLTALSLRLEMIEDELRTENADLVAAQREVARLSRLVNDLLALARADQASGAASEVMRRNCSEVLRDQLDVWRPILDEQKLILEDEIDDCDFDVNESAFAQIVDNIVSNAVDVAPAKSTLFVQLAEEDNTVVLKIRDEGRGMSEEEIVRAFDRFWRGTAAPTRFGSSGLGLPIVKELIEKEGGTVELVPQSPGLEVRLTFFKEFS